MRTRSVISLDAPESAGRVVRRVRVVQGREMPGVGNHHNLLNPRARPRETEADRPANSIHTRLAAIDAAVPATRRQLDVTGGYPGGSDPDRLTFRGLITIATGEGDSACKSLILNAEMSWWLTSSAASAFALRRTSPADSRSSKHRARRSHGRDGAPAAGESTRALGRRGEGEERLQRSLDAVEERRPGHSGSQGSTGGIRTTAVSGRFPYGIEPGSRAPLSQDHRAGSNSSIGFPSGSSIWICRPPGPVSISLRK